MNGLILMIKMMKYFNGIQALACTALGMHVIGFGFGG